MAGNPIESNEPPRDGAANAFFWPRVFFSCAILTSCMDATLAALFGGQTTIWTVYQT